ncbi:MAG: UDP-N-acetylmuramoyl-tripeptide--D-alanyl-D-alanine ligase [Mariprofundaceae bacterium]|nr:UDP-N-acetylmuramoyl-tripeptide--D-alanyl-D-alanine ligase [Mariprofundaceae bacterium]
MNFNAFTLQMACGGLWHGNITEPCQRISTDTRDLKKGDVFIALHGPHFDGHAYLEEAAKKGAIAAIVDREVSSDLPCLQVHDTLQAYADIAATWRQQFTGQVIAITGSYGKTSLRGLLEHMLKNLGYQVAATHANENNLIGVPKSILRIRQEDIAIIECGISEVTEMAQLSKITSPDIGVITGFSPAHASGLGDMKGIVREKSTLLETSHKAILGEGVSHWMHRFSMHIPTHCLDMDHPDTVSWQLKGYTLNLTHAEHQAQVDLSLPAAHWGQNIALAIEVISMFTQHSFSDVIHSLRDWQPVKGRLESIRGINSCCVLNDSYNANPASMSAALNTLRALSGSSTAILGDMAELGQCSAEQHKKLDVSGIERLLLVGSQMASLAKETPHATWVENPKEALAIIATWQLSQHDNILIKASRSIGLEQLIPALTEK